MGFALVFFGFAAFFAFFGFWCWEGMEGWTSLLSVVFWQAAFCEMFTGGLFLANALFGWNGGGLFKDSRGRMRLGARLFSWPYLLFEFSAWRRYRKRGKEPLFEEVIPGLFIGARLIDEDLDQLERAGVNAVLDLIAEFPPPRWLYSRDRFRYLAIPVIDGNAAGEKDLIHSVEFINSCREEGRSTLVHCTFGHGRSATAVAAALIAEGEAETPEEALGLLRKLKRKIWLSRAQKRLLERFHKNRQAGQWPGKLPGSGG